MSAYDNLPAKLRETGLFCCWRREQRGERTTKVPYNPRTGGKARSTDPATFDRFPVALEAAGRYDGLGVGVFGALGAIDIDHCLTDGKLSDMARDIMNTMQAYTEKSPSGEGLRILFTADGFQYDKARYYVNNQKLGLEVYIAGATNKYVTVTGDTPTRGMDLEERGEQLAEVLERYMVRPKKQQTPAPDRQPMDLDDVALVEKIKRSKGGDTFSYLWEGNFIGFYKSASEADMALCNILAWWTNRDAERMDRLFRQSGLMREKWDRPTAGSTYGKITIQEAIDSCQGGYSPQEHFQRKADKITVETAEGTRTLADFHPDKNDRYGWNDIGNGNLFADWYREMARYVPERKKWFVYDGVAWRPDVGNLRVMELCKELADNLLIYALSLTDELQRQNYLEFVRRWQVRRNRETVLKDAASVYPVALDQFDADPYLFNCLNGTLDLRSSYFRPHSPADMLTMVSGVNYERSAKCELWEKVVSDAMQGDTGKISFLMKALGYGLTGSTEEECLFILHGATTRNGKSTVMDTYMRMMGEYGRTAKPETIAQKPTVNSSGPSEDVARLAGAHVVSIAEPGKGMVLSAALVKTLTGNDKIAARFLNENSFEFYPRFKLFINTNHLPQVNDVTVFSSGRVKVIPFERHFTEEEQDKSLKQKLAKPKSLSGILNWCITGLWLMREVGFDPPEAVQTATAIYQQASDKISRFIADELEAGANFEVRTAEVYARYQAWCESNGLRYESSTKMNEALSRVAVIARKKPKAGGEKTTLLFGYRMRPTD